MIERMDISQGSGVVNEWAACSLGLKFLRLGFNKSERRVSDPHKIALETSVCYLTHHLGPGKKNSLIQAQRSCTVHLGDSAPSVRVRLDPLGVGGDGDVGGSSLNDNGSSGEIDSGESVHY
jgi:hypothetical protein